MLLANPKRLMLGYLLGAMMTSITLGLVIVFSLEGSGVVSTSMTTCVSAEASGPRTTPGPADE